MDVKQFYRYELMRYSSVDQFGDSIPTTPRLTLTQYGLVRETPKGYWIEAYYKGGDAHSLRHSDQRWIPKVSKKRYAYPTKEEALDNYIRRTTIRVGHLESQMNDAKHGMYLAKNALGSLKETIGNEL